MEVENSKNIEEERKSEKIFEEKLKKFYSLDRVAIGLITPFMTPFKPIKGPYKIDIIRRTILSIPFVFVGFFTSNITSDVLTNYKFTYYSNNNLSESSKIQISEIFPSEFEQKRMNIFPNRDLYVLSGVFGGFSLPAATYLLGENKDLRKYTISISKEDMKEIPLGLEDKIVTISNYTSCSYKLPYGKVSGIDNITKNYLKTLIPNSQFSCSSITTNFLYGEKKGECEKILTETCHSLIDEANWNFKEVSK